MTTFAEWFWATVGVVIGPAVGVLVLVACSFLAAFVHDAFAIWFSRQDD